ncbi:MAG: hypothetical protein U9N36_08430, partial [Euryarchaeota archaeon]|nr:hypothetical protein [Euryarchaeota archaeon]
RHHCCQHYGHLTAPDPAMYVPGTASIIIGLMIAAVEIGTNKKMVIIAPLLHPTQLICFIHRTL